METKVSVSKNFYKGDKIKNIEDIFDLARRRKSIYHRWHGVKPAAVYLRMQASYLFTCIENDNFFFIEPKN